MQVNFGDIPGQHNLFLDYLYEYDNVKKFYKQDFSNKEEYLKVYRHRNSEEAEILVSFILAILSWYVGIIMTCLILEKFDKICARASQSILSASFIFLSITKSFLSLNT